VRTAQNTKTATVWNATKDGNFSKKTKHPLDHPVGRRHILLCIKFEAGMSIDFTRKFISNKKRHFSGGGPSFFFIPSAVRIEWQIWIASKQNVSLEGTEVIQLSWMDNLE
jgi:hypothetical protein